MFSNIDSVNYILHTLRICWHLKMLLWFLEIWLGITIQLLCFIIVNSLKLNFTFLSSTINIYSCWTLIEITYYGNVFLNFSEWNIFYLIKFFMIIHGSFCEWSFSWCYPSPWICIPMAIFWLYFKLIFY